MPGLPAVNGDFKTPPDMNTLAQDNSITGNPPAPTETGSSNDSKSKKFKINLIYFLVGLSLINLILN